jgi:hypothetical protein
MVKFLTLKVDTTLDPLVDGVLPLHRGQHRKNLHKKKPVGTKTALAVNELVN